MRGILERSSGPPLSPKAEKRMTAKPAKTVAANDHKALAWWAADCAEHVLQHFEAQRPEDDRPRQALESARAWARGEIRCGAARAAAVAAHAAARDADEGPARAAARAAGHAAGTAHMAAHARHAAAYAATAAPVPQAEREWQSRRLPDHLRPVAME